MCGVRALCCTCDCVVCTRTRVTIALVVDYFRLSPHLKPFFYFICHFKSSRCRSLFYSFQPISASLSSSNFHASFFSPVVSSVVVCLFVSRFSKPQTIIIMRKLFVYMIYVFALKFCETLPPDMMTGKFIRLSL